MGILDDLKELYDNGLDASFDLQGLGV
jgi:hypothetical protein